MKERVKCPICDKDGRFEKASSNSYRINHDFMKNGKRTTNRCYLGNPFDIIEKLRSISKIRHDLVDSELADDVLTELKNNKNSNRLLFEILELNRKLGFGWKYEVHDLVKQDNCPHCNKKIAVRYRRLGINPQKSNGKYDVENIKIEQGQSDRTSRFKNNFTGRLKNQFERGVEKGKPEKEDIFYEDV